MNDYSIKDHIAYSMGFKDGKESQAATIAGLQAAVIQCRSLTELLKPQADRIAELEGALAGITTWVSEWSGHAGNCSSQNKTCTCGRTFNLHEARAALEGK